MAYAIKPVSDSDILIWPDGTWCFREHLSQYGHMSDDYQTLAVDTPEWEQQLEELE